MKNMTNGHAARALWVIALLVIVGTIIAGAAFITSDSSEDQRTAIFIAALFGFLTPTVATLLIIVQGKENAERIDDVHRRVDSNTRTPTSLNKEP